MLILRMAALATTESVRDQSIDPCGDGCAICQLNRTRADSAPPAASLFHSCVWISDGAVSTLPL
jgi:hypothetical protein